jgi:hypothetical protein
MAAGLGGKYRREAGGGRDTTEREGREPSPKWSI